MANLPNLGAHADSAHITQAQSQKEVTSNAIDDLLDNSNNAVVDITVSTGSPVVVSGTDFTGNVLLKLVSDTGSPGGPEVGFTLEVPNTARTFIVKNTTGQTATVDLSPSPFAVATVEVIDGETALIHGDGTTFEKVAGSTTFYDVAFFISGVPVFDAVGGMLVAVRAFTIPINATGSQAYADTPPASGELDKVFDIHKNGASVGSFTFASLANTGTFIFASAVSFVAGDRLRIINLTNPSPTEETAIANITVTFKVSV